MSKGPIQNMNTNRGKKTAGEVGTATFESQVLRSKQPVLVAFFATWSRPCQLLDETLDEVAAAHAGDLQVVKVNADNHPELSLCYDIQFIPTLLFFVDGRVRARLVGTCTTEAIISKVRAASDRGTADTGATRFRKEGSNASESSPERAR